MTPQDIVYKNCHKSFNATPLLWLSEQGARSLARIKVSAFGAGDRGFKSHRARSFFHFSCNCFLQSHILWFGFSPLFSILFNDGILLS